MSVLDLLAHQIPDTPLVHSGAPVREELVQIRPQAKVVAVLLDREVVAGGCERLDHGLDVADVQIRLPQGEADLGERGLLLLG